MTGGGMMRIMMVWHDDDARYRRCAHAPPVDGRRAFSSDLWPRQQSEPPATVHSSRLSIPRQITGNSNSSVGFGGLR
nr:hypothetical protein CFP56_56980 [Quercus suber]